ncbi:dihydropteroate synthase [Deminuibacter soli]|uniref:dihydropteroate synthase n=1 Tax=Deminuibacter soli TaxID=2291815 RepID=A0A3E1ND00_9BACT|nr:dihydropteroate synthase [Deminuibacter soli]RFM25866.1 dihydropteroate synthase [Deminuibacter soli]
MFTINCSGRLLSLHQPVVMGIINTTPDSFYGNSRIATIDAAVTQAGKMLSAGAAILDLGGQSTRPGLPQVNAEEEADRVVPVIEAIHRAFPDAIISADTYYAHVAREAVKAGAAMINDISGGLLDEAMLLTAGALQVPYICMHMKGSPENMQQLASYEDVTSEVIDYFIERTEACRLAGINDVIIDPGYGFAKTYAHNFRLLQQLPLFSVLQRPVLVGISRKSTIYRTLGISAEEALNGTTVLNTIALMGGAHILRVHDVKQAREAITLVQAVQQS